jgi:hypothetical protein
MPVWDDLDDEAKARVKKLREEDPFIESWKLQKWDVDVTAEGFEPACISGEYEEVLGNGMDLSWCDECGKAFVEFQTFCGECGDEVESEKLEILDWLCSRDGSEWLRAYFKEEGWAWEAGDSSNLTLKVLLREWKRSRGK